MKFLLLLLLAPAVAFAQTLRIADNNPNAPVGTNIFTGASALQNAINAAVPGDVVLIQPSITTYGSVTIGKRITLKGVGFNIPEMGTRTSTVTNITLINSNDGVQNISNTTLTGFICNFIAITTGTGASEYNNILIDNVQGSSVTHTACTPNINGLTIRNSYFASFTIGACSFLTNVQLYNNIIDNGPADIRRTSDLLIANNLFYRNALFVTASLSTNVRIEHNIFSGTSVSFGELNNAIVTNNIFFGCTPTAAVSSNFYENTFSNNIILNSTTMPPAAFNGGPNSGVNNIVGVSPAFVNAGVATSWTTAQNYNYTLQAGSACINAASTGDNIGPSGGLYRFTSTVTFKATALPIITQFGTSGIVPQNQPLNSSIKAKSN